jgi:hypothetical protein
MRPRPTVDAPTPTPAPTPSTTPPAWIGEQQAAMTREAQPDVLALDSLTRYDIDLSIGLESLTISGRQTMTYTNNSPDVLEELYFNLFPNSSRFAGSIEIGEVEVDGRPQAFEYERQATVAKVPLPDPLAPGETTTVELDFTARVPHVEKNYYLVFVMAQGVLSLGDWHPMVAVYDDQGWNLEYPEGTVGEIVFSESAFYTVRLTLPQVPGTPSVQTAARPSFTTVDRREISTWSSATVMSRQRAT